MAQKKPKIGDMVLVEWLDAMGHSQWSDAKGFRLKLARCETLGRLLSKNPESTVVASNRCLENDTIDHVMAIPTKCVKSLTRLSRAR